MRGLRLGLGLSAAAGGFGPELVTNGTFDTDTTGWTPTGSTLSVDTGRMKIVSNTSSPAYATQTISGLTSGASYRLLGTITPNAATPNYGRFEFSGAYGTTFSFEANGATMDVTFTAASTSLSILAENASASAWNGAGEYAFFDNISLKKIL